MSTICPECGEGMTLKRGLYGEFYSCKSFPKCRGKTSMRDIYYRVEVEKIIDKALQKDMEKRYQKAGQMAEHLQKVVARIDEIQAKKKVQTG